MPININDNQAINTYMYVKLYLNIHCQPFPLHCVSREG